MNSRRLSQIDLLKALAILSVIAQHAIPHRVFAGALGPFHLWQAVPVFLVVMGFNAHRSFVRRGYGGPLRMDWAAYLANRFSRIGIPFFVLFSVGLLIGFYRGGVSIGWMTLAGELPVSMPGNYFLTLLLQFILVFPFVFGAYDRRPAGTLLAAVTAALAFELAAPRIAFLVSNPFFYRASILRYFPALVLGMWISGHPNIGSRSNRFISAGAVVGAAYLLAVSILGYRFPLFFPDPNAPGVASVFYAGFLVLAGIRWLPDGPVPVLEKVGRLSYHIFLGQMVFFTLLSVRDLALPLPMALAFSSAAGIAAGYLLLGLETLIKKPFSGRATTAVTVRREAA
ncbi:MAG: acyltransferase family protein [Candidatus Aquicultorales bacterium]